MKEPIEPAKDFVYHLTLSDRLASLEKGLMPNPNRAIGGDDWLTLEREIDSCTPDFVARMGISRANAVFAHAEASYINGIFERNTLLRPKACAHIVALEVEVDPLKAIVCDAFELSYKMDQAKTAKRYWRTAITLDEYRRFYGIDISPWFHIARCEEAPANLPITLIQPEVLIPGPVEPERIKWFASSANKVSERRYRTW